MRKTLIIGCCLSAAIGLASAPIANAASHKHPVAAPSKAAEKNKNSIKPGKKNVASRAIANARKDVRVARVIASPHREAKPAQPILVSADNPGLQSSSALVINQQTGEVIYEKNADSVTPIASVSKLMTAMVVLDAQLPLNELISISEEDVDTLKGTGSRLVPGTTLTRGEMLLLALMSSENRAASALSRHYPGGKEAFVRAMNNKAASLGMRHSRFFDPTGLTPNNVSTPRELALMVKAARNYPEIQQFSTSTEYSLNTSKGRTLVFHNTNPLVRDENWDISLSKTGFINEAGHCLVMQTQINDVPVVMVLMDSVGKLTRVGDAQRVRKWMESNQASKLLRAG